jgi:predicted amidophosphoribosyltransferase
MIDTLLSLVIPHLCISCGQIGAILCAKCKYDIISDIKRNKLMSSGIFDISWYVGDRKTVLQRLIGSYKFNGVRAAVYPLASMLSDTAPLLPYNAIVTWIPTLPRHVRERGYDHMKQLARVFAKVNGLEAHLVLERQKQFVQHRSDRKTRLSQVKDAFAVHGEIDPERPYVLLDDILTTGSTLREATKTLKASGVTLVYVGVIARQPLD